MYRTVYQHWFFKREVENKVFWQPFSMSDSLALESHFLSRESILWKFQELQDHFVAALLMVGIILFVMLQRT